MTLTKSNQNSEKMIDFWEQIKTTLQFIFHGGDEIYNINIPI